MKKGEVLFSVATDKLTNDVEADADGILLKILLPEGETASCKSVIAYIGQPGEAIPGVASGAAPAAESAPVPAAAAVSADGPRTVLVIGGGGHFAARPELLKRLVMEAPDAIQWLNKLGVMFDKDAEGNMVTTHGGGTSRKRMHACKDYSGAEIMRTLRDEVLNLSLIHISEPTRPY